MCLLVLLLIASPPGLAALAFRSAVAPAESAKDGLASALRQLNWQAAEPAPDIALLCVPMDHASQLQELTAEAARSLGAKLLVGVVGAGVIGGGTEMDRPAEPGISLLAGILPDGTKATPFTVTQDKMPNWSAIIQSPEENAADGTPPRPGFLLFADPFSAVAQVTSILNSLVPGACVAGGLSCPPSDSSSSLALYQAGARCRALPPGSLVGMQLSGPRFELHSLTAQGAAPVGRSFLVTKGRDNLVEELEGEPTLAALQQVVEAADERVARLVQRALLVGLSDPGSADGAGPGGAAASPDGAGSEEDDDDSRDFLVRTVLGATNKGGLVVGDRVEVGKTRLRFHVRDAISASEELNLRLKRYRLERTMSGRFGDRKPLGCMLFSCNGRGLNMYDEPDHDSKVVRAALGGDLATGGWFANGEIGPLGVKGVGSAAEAPAYLHGFTSVIALLYDTGDMTTSEPSQGA